MTKDRLADRDAAGSQPSRSVGGAGLVAAIVRPGATANGYGFLD